MKLKQEALKSRYMWRAGWLLALAWMAALAVVGCGSAPTGPRPEQLGRCADQHPLRQAYFGDLHVHTGASLDANSRGTRMTAADA